MLQFLTCLENVVEKKMDIKLEMLLPGTTIDEQKKLSKHLPQILR